LHNSSIDDILNSLVNEPLSQNYDANIQSDFYISKDVIVRHISMALDSLDWNESASSEVYFTFYNFTYDI